MTVSSTLSVATGLHLAGLAALGWSLGCVAVLGWWYVAGLRRVLHRARRPRRHLVRAATLFLAVGSLVVTTGPPLGELLERRLSGHMAEHLVLIVVTAPLLVLARPGAVVAVGMPREVRGAVLGAAHRLGVLRGLSSATAALVAWCLHVGALWAWHLPAAYDAALRSPLLHLVEHASFLGTAWLFWWHVAALARRRGAGAAAAAYVATAIPPGAALGAVLTFPDHPLYRLQAARAAADGADPLLDQRIAGLVMWVPLDFAYLALAVWLFGSWLARLDGRRDADDGPAVPVLPRDAVTATVEVTR